jgi:pimeloyl-ACP methyl ester carboxylesterase
MAAFVLVHGGSSGDSLWGKVRQNIVQSEHFCYAPDLPDEHSSDLSEHIDYVFDAILNVDVEKITIVGYSYGGMVITGAAALCPTRINNIVYLDAAVPLPGQSLFDIFAEADIDPLTIPGLEALPPYLEKLHFNPIEISHLRKDFIQCTQSIFLPVTKISQKNLSQEILGAHWGNHILNTTHNAMETLPSLVSALLIQSLCP